MRVIAFGARLGIVGLVMGAALLSLLSPSGPSGLLALPYAATGAILVMRRPRSSIGWLLAGVGLCFALISVPVMATRQEFIDRSVDLPVALFAVIHAGLGTTALFLFAVLVMVFPSGRLPVGRWGRPGRAGLCVALVFAVAAYVLPEISAGYPESAWVPNPMALLPDLAIWRLVNPATVVLPVLFVMTAGAVSLGVRVRRADGTERQQLRWIAASFAVLMAAVVSGVTISFLVPASGYGLAWIPAMVALPSVPIAIGVAVLRYRLYEIDRIISRTIGWALVTGLLVAIYLAGVLLLQSQLSGITQGRTLAVAASTLLAAAMFQPARRRIQRLVDRQFDRARYDGELTLQGFSQRLRDQTDMATVTRDLSRTAGTSVSPSSLAIWLRPRAVNQ